MISVIVPVYKVEKYLRKCVDSIINQTYKDLEIILVDDGSPDKSGEICDELAGKDRRIKVIHQSNIGLSGARNSGLKVAKGDYIAFVDSDDYLSETMYESMMKLAEVTKCPIVMSGSVCVTENGKKLSSDLYEEGKIYDFKQILEKIILPLKSESWNKLYARTTIGKNTFPIGRIHGEDLVFLIQLLTTDIRIATTSEIGYFYVKHIDSITTGEFNYRSFDEIYCKDVAYNIIREKFPQYTNQALVWCFKARMNLNRKIVRTNTKMYKKLIEEYTIWTRQNYKSVKSYLSPKEILDYSLLQFTPIWFYSMVIKFIMTKYFS
nr:glycosyltransferase [Enterocloster bolteae]